MKIISKSKSGGSVDHALKLAVEEMNKELKGVDGLITKSECDVSAGPSGAGVTITLVINGNEPRHKEVIGVNEKGISKEHSVKKAVSKLNEIIGNKDGVIADIFTKTIVTPLPGRVYTTIITAINEERMEKAQDVDVRRRRIKKILELLNDDPSAINIARVADVFGVSRTVIYRDLEAMGYKRVIEKEGAET